VFAREASSSDIIKAITARDVTQTLRLLHEITIKDGDFLMLLGMLGKQLRVLWYVAGGERNLPREFWMRREDLEHVRANAKRFTRAEIERGLQGLRLLDERVKSIDVPSKLLLEHFLLDFLPERR
jgi:DNA polymerase III delta subunit